MITCKSLEAKYGCVMHVDKYEIVADAPVKDGGKGDGIKPIQILEGAYASCLNIIARIVCEKMRLPSNDVTVKVNLNISESQTVFTYNVIFGHEISEKQKATIIKALESCPVRQTLSKPISFELKDDL